MSVGRGLGGNREVLPVEVIVGADANLEKEGGSQGKSGFPRGSELKASDAHILISWQARSVSS
jgi:hypothetical protein